MDSLDVIYTWYIVPTLTVFTVGSSMLVFVCGTDISL